VAADACRHSSAIGSSVWRTRIRAAFSLMIATAAGTTRSNASCAGRNRATPSASSVVSNRRATNSSIRALRAGIAALEGGARRPARSRAN